MSLPWTEDRLYDALRERFAEPEWVLFPHVRDRAGYDGTRTADAVAMNVWPSRGLVLCGFEIKATRKDWLRELAQPQKAEPFLALLDQWYVVAPKDVVRDGELPAGWGLMVPRGRKLVAAVAPAPANESRDRPVPRDFVAAVFRRAAEVVGDAKVLKAEYRRGFEAGMEAGGRTEAREVTYLNRQLEELRAGIKGFEEASGLRFSHWQGGRIGEAVRAVLDGESRVESANQALRRIGGDARRLAESVDRALAENEPVKQT